MPRWRKIWSKESVIILVFVVFIVMVDYIQEHSRTKDYTRILECESTASLETKYSIFVKINVII